MKEVTDKKSAKNGAKGDVSGDASGAAKDPSGSVDAGRRTFLKGSLWAAAAAASGGLVYRAAFGKGTPRPGLLALTQAEYATACAVAEAFFPGTIFPIGPIQAQVGESIDRNVSDMPPSKARLFKLLLRTTEYAPLVTLGRACHFSSLSLAERQEFLERWENSSIYSQRLAHRVLLFACSSGYFENEAVLASMGWGIGCSPSPRLPGEIL